MRHSRTPPYAVLRCTATEYHHWDPPQARHMAVMSVSSTDWAKVDELAASDDRVIPCYGVHPWQAHKHASKSQREGCTVADVLKGTPREGAEAIASAPLLQVRLRSATSLAQFRPDAPQRHLL